MRSCLPLSIFTIIPCKQRSMQMPSKKAIVKAVATDFGISVEDMFRKCRKREFVTARMIAMQIIKDLEPHITLKAIGDFFGKRDHTTVMYNLKTLEDLMFMDQRLKERVIRIRSMI